MRSFQQSFRLILLGLVAISAASAWAQSISKPFSNYQPRPTVSPYLNLFRTDGSDFDYQTLVQPMLRQQEINQRQQQTNLRQIQTNSLQQRTNRTTQQDIRRASQAPTSPIPQATLRPTGMGITRRVGSRFMNTYNYYPPPRIPRQR